MATTALIVEVLVIGGMASIWIAGALLFVVPIHSVRSIALEVRDFMPLLVVPTLALTYTAGWLVNFCSERALKWLLQKRVRDREFGNNPAQYQVTRVIVLQQASADHIHELLLDRHVVRVARGAILNFLASAIVAGYGLKGYLTGWWVSAICAVLAALSFAQWLTRYRAHYVRIKKIREMLASKEGPSKKQRGAGI